MSHLHSSLSILGMHIFGCKFSLRTDTGDTVPDRKNFDSLLWAIVTVFQVSDSTCSCVSGEGVSPRTAAWIAFQRWPLGESREEGWPAREAPPLQPPADRSRYRVKLTLHLLWELE